MSLSRDEFGAAMIGELSLQRSRGGFEADAPPDPVDAFRALWYDMPDVTPTALAALHGALREILASPARLGPQAGGAGADGDPGAALRAAFCLGPRLLDGVRACVLRPESGGDAAALAACVYILVPDRLLRCESADEVRCVLRGLGAAPGVLDVDGAPAKGEEAVVEGLPFPAAAAWRSATAEELCGRLCEVAIGASYGLISALGEDAWRSLGLSDAIERIIDALRGGGPAAFLLGQARGAEGAALRAEWPRFLFLLRDRCLHVPSHCPRLVAVLDGLLADPDPAAAEAFSGAEAFSRAGLTIGECIALMTASALGASEAIARFPAARTCLKRFCVRCLPTLAGLCAHAAEGAGGGGGAGAAAAASQASTALTVLEVLCGRAGEAWTPLPEALQDQLLRKGAFRGALALLEALDGCCRGGDGDSRAALCALRDRLSAQLAAQALRGGRLLDYAARARKGRGGVAALLLVAQQRAERAFAAAAMAMAADAGALGGGDAAAADAELARLCGGLRAGRWTLREVHGLVEMLGGAAERLKGRGRLEPLRDAIMALDDAAFEAMRREKAEADGDAEKEREAAAAGGGGGEGGVPGAGEQRGDRRLQRLKMLQKRIAAAERSAPAKLD